MTLFALQKTIAFLIMPLGLLWLALLLGAGFCWRRRLRGPAAAALALAVLLGILGNPCLGWALIASLERRTAPVELAAVEPFDAVCVLGGGSDQDPAGRPELGGAGDRLVTAARLWHAGKARLLVASGMGRDGVHGFHDGGQETRELWLALGIPDSAILVVADPCWVTRDEISAYRRLRERHGWRRMGLVTSAFHLPRALRLAAKAGLPVTPVGADWRGRSHSFQLQYLVPQAEGLYCTQLACWEYVGRWLGR